MRSLGKQIKRTYQCPLKLRYPNPQQLRRNFFNSINNLIPRAHGGRAYLPRKRGARGWETFSPNHKEMENLKENVKVHNGSRGKRRWTKGRKELPKVFKPSLKNKKKKPSLKAAVKIVKNRRSRKIAVQRLEEDFFANSSRASKLSKRSTVETVLKTVTKGPTFSHRREFLKSFSQHPQGGRVQISTRLPCRSQNRTHRERLRMDSTIAEEPQTLHHGGQTGDWP